jgi:hypothetical protein
VQARDGEPGGLHALIDVALVLPDERPRGLVRVQPEPQPPQLRVITATASHSRAAPDAELCRFDGVRDESCL